MDTVAMWIGYAAMTAGGIDNDDGITVHITEYLDDHNNDPYAATRRAIVRAAYKIWKEKKDE